MGIAFDRKNRRRFWLVTFFLSVLLLSFLRVDFSLAQAVGKFLINRQLPDQGADQMLLTIQPQLTVAPGRPISPPNTWKVSQEICKQFGFPGEKNTGGVISNYLYAETANGIGMCCKVETNTLCSIDDGSGDTGVCPAKYNAAMLNYYTPGVMANFVHHLMGITGTYSSGTAPWPYWTSEGCVYICGNYGSLPPCCGIPRPTTCQDTNPTPTIGSGLDCQSNWRQMTLAAPCGKGPIPQSGIYLVDPVGIIGLDPHMAACFPFRETKNAPTPGMGDIFDFQRGSAANPSTLDTVYPGTWYPGQYIWPTPHPNFQ